MREIKFRAWDKNNNKMVFVGDKYAKTYGQMIDMFEDEDLMQFTGLHDAKGKEIYEGDIIRNNYSSVKVIIAFKHACFGSLMDDIFISFTEYGTETYLKTECEVIGNIHDNKEILGDK